MDTNSLAHTKWECKYHIVFALKFSGVIYEKIRVDIGNILCMLCTKKRIQVGGISFLEFFPKVF